MLNSSIHASAVAARVALGFSCVFLILLGSLHFLKPEFDPSWRMISEYAIGRHGWMMSLAFFCWGGSVLTLLLCLWSALGSTVGKIGRGWLFVIGMALFGAGLFETNEITDPTPSFEDNMHRICGVIVILTFPIAASLVAAALARGEAGSPARRRLLWTTLLVWLGQLGFFASIMVSRMVHPSAGRVGPEVLMGWPNRMMVVLYHLWIIVQAAPRVGGDLAWGKEGLRRSGSERI